MGKPGRGRRVSDEEILQAFKEAEEPVLTTREVGDAVGLGRRGTLERLSQLEDTGVIKRKKIGEVGAVWWFPKHLEERY